LESIAVGGIGFAERIKSELGIKAMHCEVEQAAPSVSVFRIDLFGRERLPGPKPFGYLLQLSDHTWNIRVTSFHSSFRAADSPIAALVV
jgi:hypothetical protein